MAIRKIDMTGNYVFVMSQLAVWFFSTLAQSAAGILAFIVAISTVIYSIKRQKRNERTDELREDLSKLSNQECELINHLHIGFLEDDSSGRLVEQIPKVSDMEELYEYELGKKDEIEEDLIEDFQIALGRVIAISLDIEYTAVELERDEIEQLSSDLDWLSAVIQYDSYRKSLYKYKTGNEPGDYYMYENIIDRYLLYTKYQEWASEEISNTVFNRFEDQTSILSGRNIYSMDILFRKASVDMRNIENKVGETTLAYSPFLRNVMVISTLLLAIGIVLPLMLLITVPFPFIPTLSATHVFFLELIVLSLVFVFIYVLVEINIRGLEDYNLKEENLTLASNFVLKYVPFTRVNSQ